MHSFQALWTLQAQNLTDTVYHTKPSKQIPIKLNVCLWPVVKRAFIHAYWFTLVSNLINACTRIYAQKSIPKEICQCKSMTRTAQQYTSDLFKWRISCGYNILCGYKPKTKDSKIIMIMCIQQWLNLLLLYFNCCYLDKFLLR